MRSVMIDQCGHYLAEERPEQLKEELLKSSRSQPEPISQETEDCALALGLQDASIRKQVRRQITWCNQTHFS